MIPDVRTASLIA